MTGQVWYTRRGGVVQGPFPRGLVTRYVILGRIQPDDELSRDLSTWVPLGDVPDLIPDVVRSEGPTGRRLDAARRWENERERQERRRALDAIDDERRGIPERRSSADAGPGPVIRHEDLSVHLTRRHRLRRRAAVIALGILAVPLALLVLHQPPPPPAPADCRAAARPGVNWDNCGMEGRRLARSELSGARMTNMSLSRADLSGARLASADLSYTNLTVARLRGADLGGARLVGASLRGADLTEAGLEEADLSYADLQGAELRGVRLRGASLDHAVWSDGTVCDVGSRGGCIPVSP